MTVFELHMVGQLTNGWNGQCHGPFNMKGTFLDQYPEMCVKMVNVDFMKNLSRNDQHGHHWRPFIFQVMMISYVYL